MVARAALERAAFQSDVCRLASVGDTICQLMFVRTGRDVCTVEEDTRSERRVVCLDVFVTSLSTVWMRQLLHDANDPLCVIFTKEPTLRPTNGPQLSRCFNDLHKTEENDL